MDDRWYVRNMNALTSTKFICIFAAIGTASALFACSNDESSDDTTADTSDSGSNTGDSSADTDSSTTGDSSAANDDAASTGDASIDCDQKTAALPSSSITIEGITYYPVLETVLTTNPYRKQINFGTAEQFHKCPEEAGQNSTLAIQFTFNTKPAASASYTYTDNRAPETTDVVNLYASFFNNTGHARASKNYLSPATGTMALTVTGMKATTTITSLTMAGEANAGDTFPLSGTVEMNL